MQRINNLYTQIVSSKRFVLLLILMLGGLSGLLFFRIAPTFLENPGIVFARMAYTLSLPLDQVELGTISLLDWFTSTRAEIGFIQFSYLGPVALVYSFFGAGGSSALIMPFVFHFATVLLLYGMANEIFHGNNVGLFAAFLWVVFPATTFFSSAFPLTAAFAFITVVGLFAEIKYVRTGSIYFLVISAGTIGWAFLVWPGLAMSLIAFGVAVYLWEQNGIRLSIQKIIISFAALAILLLPNLAVGIRSLIDQLYQSPGLLIFFLLFLLALVANSINSQRNTKYTISLVLFAALIFIAYEYLPPTENLFSANIGGFPLIILFIPAIFLVANSLVTWIPELHFSWAAPMALALGLIFALYADLNFYIQQDRFFADLFISVSRISAGMLVLGFLLFVITSMLSKKSFEAQLGILCLLILPMASVFPLAGANFENVSTSSSYQRAATLAQTMAASDSDLKIYVCNRRLRDRFWYMANFSDFGLINEASGKNPFLKPPTNIANRESGIAIIDKECSEIDSEIYNQWNLLFTFGEKRNQLDFYRILP